MIYSYERVSTLRQDERRQEISLEGYKIDRRYIDKQSGKNADRPELQRLLADAKDGDRVYTEAISRLGRNVDDLRELVERFKAAGVVVHFVKEGFDTSGHMYKFMLTILGAVAEMEREMLVDRVKEGMEKARRYGTRSGKPIGRPAPELPKAFYRYYEKLRDGEINILEFAKLLEVSKATAYRWIAQHKSRG